MNKYNEGNYGRQRFCARIENCTGKRKHFDNGGTCYEGGCAMSRFYIKFPWWNDRNSDDECSGVGAMCNIELIKKIQEAKNEQL